MKTVDLSVVNYTQHQHALLPLAREAHDAMGIAGDKWRTMVRYINSNQMSREECSPVLLEAGWNKVRVSEIQRIAFAEPEVVTAYLSKALDWKPALEKARETKTKHKGGRKANFAMPLFQVLKKTMKKHAAKKIKPFAQEFENGVALIVPDGNFSGKITLPVSGIVLEVTITKLEKSKGKTV